MLRTLIFVLPLAIDTFVVSAALGAQGLSSRSRLRISFLFAGFEMAMPLAGFAVGAAVSTRVGSVADYVAVALLIAVGAYMVWPDDDGDEAAKAVALARAKGWAMIGLGVSISLDELAIGFTIGLLGLSLVTVVLLVGVQAFIAAQLGVRLGSKVGEHFRERAEQLAGLVLIVLGVVVLIEHIS